MSMYFFLWFSPSEVHSIANDTGNGFFRTLWGEPTSWRRWTSFKGGNGKHWINGNHEITQNIKVFPGQHRPLLFWNAGHTSNKETNDWSTSPFCFLFNTPEERCDFCPRVICKNTGLIFSLPWNSLDRVYISNFDISQGCFRLCVCVCVCVCVWGGGGGGGGGIFCFCRSNAWQIYSK